MMGIGIVKKKDKLSRYGPLDDAITSNGWKHSLFCVEVGARGYCANSVLSCFKSLGFSNKPSSHPPIAFHISKPKHPVISRFRINLPKKAVRNNKFGKSIFEYHFSQFYV